MNPSQDTAKKIVGSEKIITVFGEWPSFHDAEVHWFRLDHINRVDQSHAPTAEALIHLFQSTDEVDARGYHVRRQHTLVRLRFIDVAKVRVNEFYRQNVLFDLSLVDNHDRHLERRSWFVHFESSVGMDTSFDCDAIEVVEATPCNSNGRPLT